MPQFANQSSPSASLRSYVEASYIYDGSQRIVQAIEPSDAQGDAQAVTTTVYDNASRVSQVTDPLNRTLVYTYDDRDRVVKITYGPELDGAVHLRLARQPQPPFH